MINIFWSIPQRFFHNAIAWPELVFIFNETQQNDVVVDGCFYPTAKKSCVCLKGINQGTDGFKTVKFLLKTQSIISIVQIG